MLWLLQIKELVNFFKKLKDDKGHIINNFMPVNLKTYIKWTNLMTYTVTSLSLEEIDNTNNHISIKEIEFR